MYITINKKPFTWKKWKNKVVNFIGDAVTLDGNFELEYVKEKYSTRSN